MKDQQAPVQQVVIVGASYGGLAVANELRAAGFEGQIRLIGEEHVLPYHRTHLSKECLAGDARPPSPLRPESFFADQAIDLHTGTSVVEIRRDARMVRCSDGTEFPYDRLVLAVGARARRVPGMDDGQYVLSLRNASDAELLVSRLQSARRVAIIGGGLIGLEVAAAARNRGLEVTLLEAAPRLMARSVYAPISDHTLTHHQTQGIDIRLGVQVSKVTATGVVLADGSIITADLVLAALGSIPRIDLAGEAGIACPNGIATDANGQTSDAHIYALGDCALWNHVDEPQRHESVPAAQAQAAIVAAAILGLPPKEMPSLRLWSTQGSLRLQMTGPVHDDADVSLEEVDGGGLIARVRRNSRLVAIQSVNAPRFFNAALKDLGRMEEEFAGA